MCQEVKIWSKNKQCAVSRMLANRTLLWKSRSLIECQNKFKSLGMQLLRYDDFCVQKERLKFIG